MVQKVFYPFEYIDDSEKINETSLPEKEDFYSNLKKEDITDADCNHEKEFAKNLKQKTSVIIMICGSK